jgi:RNA recognition motif-containing protein
VSSLVVAVERAGTHWARFLWPLHACPESSGASSSSTSAAESAKAEAAETKADASSESKSAAGASSSSSSADGVEDPTNLIINYIPSSVSDDILKGMFHPYGQIENCKVVKDRSTGA